MSTKILFYFDDEFLVLKDHFSLFFLKKKAARAFREPYWSGIANSIKKSESHNLIFYDLINLANMNFLLNT